MAKGRSKDARSTFPVEAGCPPPLATVCPLGPWEEFLCCVVLFFIPGAALWVPVVALGLAVVGVAGYGWVYLGVFSAVLAASFLVPAGLRQGVLHSHVATLMLKYFSFKIVWNTRLDPKDRHILAAHPHGAFPVGNMLSLIVAPDGAGFYVRALAASAALYVPFYRQLLGWIGAVHASRSEAHRLMVSSEPHGIGLNPGGIAEIFHVNDSEDETIYLRHRKGFVRLALEHGAVLVPGYCFGNTQCLKVVTDRWGVCKRVSRALRVSLVLIFGRFGLPIPFRTPIAAVMGPPIRCPKVPSPPPELVDEYHKRFMDELVEVFNLHKTAYGWPESRKLRIL